MIIFMKKNYFVIIGACALLTAGTTAIGQSQPKGFKYIDKSNMDQSVKPGDNFYLYANGRWLKNNPCLPAKPDGAVLICCGRKASNACEPVAGSRSQYQPKTDYTK